MNLSEVTPAFNGEILWVYQKTKQKQNKYVAPSITSSARVGFFIFSPKSEFEKFKFSFNSCFISLSENF